MSDEVFAFGSRRVRVFRLYGDCVSVGSRFLSQI